MPIHTKNVNRQDAVTELQRIFLTLVDDECCMCKVAARLGIYCSGFAQHTFEELKQRYHWLVTRRPDITRHELERLANIWQLARQDLHCTALSCDTQSIEHDTCMGWDGWTNADLQCFLHELGAKELVVVGSN